VIANETFYALFFFYHFLRASRAVGGDGVAFTVMLIYPENEKREKSEGSDRKGGESHCGQPRDKEEQNNEWFFRDWWRFEESVFPFELKLLGEILIEGVF